MHLFLVSLNLLILTVTVAEQDSTLTSMQENTRASQHNELNRLSKEFNFNIKTVYTIILLLYYCPSPPVHLSNPHTVNAPV